jgi:hypothetical protein
MMADEEVVTTPPEGNLGVTAPGERQITDNCRHDFIKEYHPLIDTGYDVCIHCKLRVPARRREQGPYCPPADDKYTGYRRIG